jgi:hypothetical protein
MRKLITILLVIICQVSFGQVYQIMPQYGYSAPRFNTDSTLQLPTFNGVPTLKSNKTNKGAIAIDSTNGRFYFYNPKTSAWSQVTGGGGSTDTTSLSNRINLKIDSLKKSNDTIYTYKNGSRSFAYTDSIGVPYTGATANVNLGIRNITANAYFNGFTSMIAAGTTVTLTVDSTPVHLVSGSGGQTFKLPLATTLPSGTIFSFNNNQSSGVISVNNNSNTLVKSVPSGAYLILELTDNTTSTGSWDAHFQTPSNAAWSTNTLDWAGSFTNGTWNGSVVAYNRGGTGSSSTFTQGGIAFGSNTSALGTTAAGTAGQLLTSAGTGTPIWTNALDTTSLSNRINLKLNSADTSTLSTRIDSKLAISDTSTMLSKYLRKTDTASLSSRIDAKLAITDTSAFQRKNLASYTFIANNTTATANGTAQTFRDSAQKSYTGTITWTGTGPTGATNHSYHWSQVGKLITLRINLIYASAGTATAVNISLPSDCPTPELPTGLSGADRILGFCTGFLVTSTNTNPTTAGATVSNFKINSANNGYEFYLVRASASIIAAYLTVSYFAQ